MLEMRYYTDEKIALIVIAMLKKYGMNRKH